MTGGLVEFTYRISANDIDKSLLPDHARTVGTDDYRAEVSKLIQQDFADFGGWAQIVVNDDTIQVTWRPDPTKPSAIDVALERLAAGDYRGAVNLMEIMRKLQPEDATVLYNLGMAYSDMAQFDRAGELLSRLVELHPDHVNGRTAMGVALARQGKTDEAIEVLRMAVTQAPDNPWAHRNLGACLLKTGETADALHHLRFATELNPDDQQSLYGLAQAYEINDDEKAADELYIKVIELDGQTPTAEAAKEARSKMARESFRSRVQGGTRPDAVMYLLGCIQKFEKLSFKEIQAIAFEIAILGQRGLDTNDSAQKYQLRSLPGKYSGLHLVCIMYVGFKAVAPTYDVGFDLAKEYEAAKAMHEPQKGNKA